MYENQLQECGLTKNESLVYLALLRLGKAKTGTIVKEAKISGGKVYETLYKLIDKGLVKVVTENGIKHFIANSPETLMSYMQERDESLHKKGKELESIIPELTKLQLVSIKEFESVSLVKDMRGIRTLVYDILEKGKEIKIMGVRSSKDETFNNFWRGWHRRRVELKKKAKILFSDKHTEYWNFFKKLPYTEVKEMLHFTPSAIMIIDNNTFIFSYDKEFTCIHISSVSIARSFSQFFDDLWRISPKT